MNTQTRLLRLYFHYLGTAFPARSMGILWKIFRPGRVQMRPHHEAVFRQAAQIHWPHPARADHYMVAHTWGQGDRTVLLLHGWGGAAYSYHVLVPRLLAGGFRVVAVDAPAHGASEGDYTHVPDMAAALQIFLRQEGMPYAVVAHSLGGLVAGLAFHEQGQVPEKCVFLGSSVCARSVFETYFDQLRVPASLRREFYERFLAETGYPLRLVDLRQYHDQWAKTRILPIYDEGDTVVPVQEPHAFWETQPTARPLWLTGAGHYGLLKDPRVMDAVVGFLT